MTAADFLTDHWGRHHLAVSLLEEDDRHALADVIAGHFLEDPGALVVERQIHGRFLRLGVEARLCVLKVFTGQQHAAADEHLVVLAVSEDLVTERNRAGCHLGISLRRVIHHADFERCRTAENVLSLRRILHARQLNHNAGRALLGNHRLRNAEFIDSVMQRGDILLDRVVLNVADRLIGHAGNNLIVAAVLTVFKREIRIGAADQIEGLIAGVLIRELHHDRVAGAVNAVIADVLIAELRADIGRVRVNTLLNGGLHIDFETEMHSAAKVKTEVHRLAADRREPFRSVRHEVQRDHIIRVRRIRVQSPFQHLTALKLELGVRHAETHADAGARLLAAGIQVDGLRLDSCGSQRVLNLRHGGIRYLHRRLSGRDLNSRRLAEEVRDRVENTDDEGKQDDEVFPNGITIHLDYPKPGLISRA